MTDTAFEFFVTAPPGLEDVLLAEMQAKGFASAVAIPGGVTVQGGWPEVWRANLELRGAGRVLARIGGFLAFHLAQLDKRARKFPWGEVLRPEVPVRVEVTCRASKIYHAGAAQQRIETALRDGFGATVDPAAPVVLKIRIDDNNVLVSVDTSGESLHKRGHKEAVGKAPMRETLAAMFLARCGHAGTEPVLDPMCGSGTFVLEAAEIAAGLAPGRDRRFAFEQLATFDPAAWSAMKDGAAARAVMPAPMFYGSDRDAGAVRMSRDNAARAGLADATRFDCLPAADIVPPEGPPGLVIVNPPYGGRIGNRKLLLALHGQLGEALLTRFRGWRVGLVTSEPPLARAPRLPFGKPGAPVPHGGLKVQLYQPPPLR
ncbi:THUMP domain-containing class I SAM-dependent RNA methyltransferase [Oceaniglobus roseus]|uniref:THUMP domain-containing class I SAM-dependent RNA methyltransferase n=1 Tax=Oceaniglobus roseus TaxID=1737570 RepID=UPI000C7EF766|nr:RNA methyltransferase [Kandeliimicrobium roseum]